jgi:hypothetical protein
MIRIRRPKMIRIQILNPDYRAVNEVDGTVILVPPVVQVYEINEVVTRR